MALCALTTRTSATTKNILMISRSTTTYVTNVGEKGNGRKILSTKLSIADEIAFWSDVLYIQKSRFLYQS